MDHPFEYRAHYRPDGEPCHCPWGIDEGGEHLGSVRESSKLDWLKARPDLQTPEGQQFLEWLQQPDVRGHKFSDADKMLPWLVREWKKGRVKPSRNGETHHLIHEEGLRPGQFGNGSFTGKFTPKEAVEAQASLEEMQKRDQGVDLMQHKIHELLPKVEGFQDWKKSQGREHLGEPLHQFPDGWSIRRLQNEDECIDEGKQMSHCMQEYGKRYHDQVENGERIFASLRDHHNLPHATIELNPYTWQHPTTGETTHDFGYQQLSEGWKPIIDPGTRLGEFYGKQDAPPIPEYMNRINQWLAPYGINSYDYHPNGNIRVPGEGVFAATKTRPLYYRWIYSPTKGVVVNSNQDDHPALVKYHPALGGDINDTDLVHGYASALDGGWRITDLEHKPVEDPYIVQQVVRRLNHEDGPQMTAEGSWKPSEFDWDRIHYGIPCEKSVS